VVVSYRSAALAVAAIADLRREAAAGSLEIEVVTVVNSGDASEAADLRGAADVVLEPGRNLGFAGGLNRGTAAARGELLLLANPDIALAPGALTALLSPLLADPAALLAVGPAYFWDDAQTLQLPPAEEPRPADLLRRAALARSSKRPRLFARGVRRARREHDRVERGETYPVSALWGALVATSRRTLRIVGAFDEGYALYYEEHDWQRRLRAMRGTLLRAGGSRVIHRFNQSARLEPKAAGWFASSERRYFTSHFGERGVKALAALSESSGAAPGALPSAPALQWRSSARAAVAVSPFDHFHPFAYARLHPDTRTWALPEGVRSGLAGALHARVFDEETLETLAEARIA